MVISPRFSIQQGETVNRARKRRKEDRMRIRASTEARLHKTQHTKIFSLFSF